MNPHPYQHLDPDTLIGAVESLGYAADGRLLALNSYENRVYQIGINDAPPLVGKFYRPERWSDAAIEEEHRFALALASEEIPVVPPLLDAAGRPTGDEDYQGIRRTHLSAPDRLPSGVRAKQGICRHAAVPVAQGMPGVRASAADGRQPQHAAFARGSPEAGGR